jgi:two-component system LytT family response regulator
MPALRVLIVDDEKPARENLRVLLAQRPDLEIAGLCPTGAAAIHALTTSPIDVLFLDIKLPDMNGFDVLRALEPDERPVVVLVTAFHTYAVQAFEASAIDYLVKPFSDERFGAALDRARRQVEGRDAPEVWRRIEGLLRRSGTWPPEEPIRRLVLRSGGRTEFLPVDQIDWIEAVNVYVRIHAGEAVHLIRQTMAELESRLDPREFVRIHRSTIVNLARVKALQKDARGRDEALLNDGTRLRMSRARRGRLEEALGERP